MNVIDYINKYGDYKFEQVDINEIDKLIFSIISYVDFKGIIPSNGTKITLEEAGYIFFNNNTKKDIRNNILAVRFAIGVLDKLRKKDRYKDLFLYNYVYIGDENQQFAALSIDLGKNIVYVSFEGTDQLISGWEEDCKMSYRFPVPAQKQAKKYLNKYFTFRKCKLIIGGHSKGGNLSLVSSMYCNFLVRNKILEIYSYDGQGLRKKQIESKRYKRIKPRYTHVIPNNSIIGLILRHDSDYKVIKSNRPGILAHSVSTWMIENTFFKPAELSKSSKIVDVSITKWLDKYSDAQRKEFVKYIFDVFKKNNIIDLVEIMRDYRLLLRLIRDTTRIDSHVVDMTKDLIKVLKYYNEHFNEIEETDED